MRSMMLDLLTFAPLIAMALMPAVPVAGRIDGVESRLFRGKRFRLQSGVELPELVLAYETYGTLAPDGRNAVLVTHGFTSNHHFAGTYRPGGAPKGLRDDDVGSWDKLIGPGKPIDTNKVFVISSNMLGSSYGSTAPASLNPETCKPYGPDFPRITVADIVNAQKELLDSLGVTHLVAVAGPSYGGFQAFQWAVSYPAFMHGIVPVVTAPRSATTPEITAALRARLAKDPNWNGGWYYDRGGIKSVMTEIRVETLKNYGIEARLRPHYPNLTDLEAAIVAEATPWAEAFDGQSMVVLRRALEGFDTTTRFDSIKARVLYVLSRTDKLYPPSIAPDVMARLAAAGVPASYVEIDTELGHMASGIDGDKWGPSLAAFMETLIALG